MATWTLLLLKTPLNTTSGTSSLIMPLRLATGISMSYKLAEAATLNFNVPGQHYQTSFIQKGTTDVLVLRDDFPVQRFRVISTSFSSSAGKVDCAVTCASYREVINGWMFHGSDNRSWEPDSTGASTTDQTEIAWEIINQGQSKPFGNIGVTRGVNYAENHPRSLWISDLSTETEAKFYFDAGEKIGDSIQTKIADLSGGFEWDIEPERTNFNTALANLKYNVWDIGERSINPGAPSTLVLTTASMASWSLVETMANYANVIRETGADDTVENTQSQYTLPGPVVYAPVSENPAGVTAGTDHPGRWELNDTGASDIPTQAEVQSYADRALDEHSGDVSEWQCQLHPSRWQGPEQLWLGDNARVILQIPAEDEDGTTLTDVDGNPVYILDVDKFYRVIGVDVSVDSSGAEQVSLSLNLTSQDLFKILTDLRGRIVGLERR